MRTTVAIDDELLASARGLARLKGMTLGQVVDEALRLRLAQPPTPAGPPVPVFRGGTGVRPGVDLDSNRTLSEVLDEGTELDQLR